MRTKLVERQFRQAICDGYDPYNSLDALKQKWLTQGNPFRHASKREFDANRFLKLQA